MKREEKPDSMRSACYQPARSSRTAFPRPVEIGETLQIADIDELKSTKMVQRQPDTKASIFGEYIRKRRKELHISQNGLADKVGVRQPYLSNIEQGQVLPSLDLVVSIAKVLAIPNCYLFSLLGHCEQPTVPHLMEVALDEDIQIKVADTRGKRIEGRDLELIRALIKTMLDKE
jgi:transcriptional regulator with XRE-family HTH domain